MTLTAQCLTDSEDRLRRAQGMLQNGRTAALSFYKCLLAKVAPGSGSDQGCLDLHGNERDPEPVNMLL